MSLDGVAVRITAYIGESDRHGHKPLYTEIVHRAHAAGLAGVSVFRGIEGYGASHHVHTTRILSLSEDLPLAVVIVDTRAKVEAFLPQLEELVTEGLITLDEVRVVKYAGRTGRTDRTGRVGGGSGAP